MQEQLMKALHATKETKKKSSPVKRVVNFETNLMLAELGSYHYQLPRPFQGKPKSYPGQKGRKMLSMEELAIVAQLQDPCSSNDAGKAAVWSCDECIERYFQLLDEAEMLENLKSVQDSPSKGVKRAAATMSPNGAGPSSGLRFSGGQDPHSPGGLKSHPLSQDPGTSGIALFIPLIRPQSKVTLPGGLVCLRMIELSWIFTVCKLAKVPKFLNQGLCFHQ
jgi:hypothetical protein